MTKTISVFDIGNVVICDACGVDYSTSDAVGGFLFASKAICPRCAPRFEKDAVKYGEQHFITKRAGDKTFREFVLELRDGNNTVTITSSDNVEDIIKELF